MKKNINEIDKKFELDEFDITNIYAIFSIILRSYYIIILVAFLAVISSIIYLKLATYKYTVTLTVIPVSNKNSPTGASSKSNFASIIGVSVPSMSANGNEFYLYKNLMLSKSVAKEISKDKEFMTSFFSNSWDLKKGEWIEPQINFKTKIKNFIKSTIGLPIYFPETPNHLTIHKYVKDNVVINSNKQELTKIKLLTSDYKNGKLLLNTLHKKTDEMLKKRSMSRTESHIKFLNKQINKTFQYDQKQSLIIALASEQKKRMMASSSLPYVAEPFDGNAERSFYPTSPHPSKLLIQNFLISIVIGCLLPILFVLLNKFINNLKKH